jgi:hypothetical protein
MRATHAGQMLFKGYACDYHKATLRSYSSIAPPMVGRYEADQAYLAVQGRVFVVCYGEAANWQEREDIARHIVATYRYAPYGSNFYPCPPELALLAIR